jgi:hypothetical protein
LNGLNLKQYLKRENKLKCKFFSLLFISLIGLSCSVYETFVNIARLKFKLGEINNFLLCGVKISDKSTLTDFKAMELLQISSSFAKGSLPVSFTLNIEAENPNTGKGGYPKTNAAINSFPWRLLIDEKETISGNISSPVSVPGTGESEIFPLQINMDLILFFKEKGYESLINLALNIGGYGRSSSKLALYAKPSVSTSLGVINYPKELKIVSTEFNN